MSDERKPFSYKALQEAYEQAEERKIKAAAKWEPLARLFEMPEFRPLSELMEARIAAFQIELESCPENEVSMVRGRIRELRWFSTVGKKARTQLQKLANKSQHQPKER